MSQAKRTKKTEIENELINEILTMIEEKYNISKDLVLNSINPDRIKFKLQKYNISIQDIEYEIEAIAFNEKDKDITADAINEAINKLIERREKENEENITINKIPKKIEIKPNQKNFLQETSSSAKKAPAKNDVIPTNSNVNIKYAHRIMYNEGENEMEKRFNEMNPELKKEQLNIIPSYDLLPKDFNEQKDKYIQFFYEIKMKILENEKISKDDALLDSFKFVLFVAFDVIDAKPTFEELIGIDPLKDFKKYILKINTNNNNLFFVSGQIIYIEGDLVDNGKIIEVRNYRNIYDITEFSIPYEETALFYEKYPEPYALYYMNGPYFSKENMDLTVFKDAIKKVSEKNPHYFLVNGPFFSTENDKVKWGEVDTDKGMKQILELLIDEFKDNNRTKIFICPGISDNENFYPLPQPPFDKIMDFNNFLEDKQKKEDFISRIYFISNPQIIPLNEAFIGIANFDTIRDIITNSVHSPQINTVQKACELILSQRNFYPVLPNTLQQAYENNQEKTITVDLSQYKYLHFGNFDTPPDIILTNSVMKNFTTRIKGTVFVNCGSFVKGKNFGEIAKITLHNVSKGTDIYRRLKVEFIKITENKNSSNNNTNYKK